MADIPQELINEILLFSLVKSLLRFRCLSKSLCATIDSLDFINSHLARSSENMIHQKLIFQDRLSRFHVCDMNDGQEEEIQLKKLPNLKGKVHGYCNGLVLLYQESSKFALWNPSTGQYMNLPDCPAIVGLNRLNGSGLGYDSIDGYKVVLMFETTSQLEVWNFGVRSNTWTRVWGFPYYYESFKYCSRTYQASTGTFADGGLYWLPWKVVHQSSQPNKIVAFDLRKGIFSLEVPPPVCSIPRLTDLHVLKGRLCMSFCYTFPYQADLYVRNKDLFSWTLLYSIMDSISLDIYRFHQVKVLGYLTNKDNILLDFGMEDVFSYDIEKKSIEKVGLKRNPLWNDPIICIESLASVRCGA